MTSSFEKYLVLSIHFLIHNLRLSEINNVVSSSGPTRTQDQDQGQEEEGGTVAEELVEGELLWAMMVSALNVNSMVTLLEDVQTSIVNASVKKVCKRYFSRIPRFLSSVQLIVDARSILTAE